MSGSHRARRKRREETPPASIFFSPSKSSSVTTATAVTSPTFPLAASLWPARGSTSQWVVLPAVLMFAGLFRWCTGLWPYSGLAKPPMHGDFEAQRHWIELTSHLPVTHWYFHDLQWWGLDYPPLTAYHSWTMGQIGALINSSWFALYLSRGTDDADLKVFMRATVIISEYLIYIPAVVLAVRHIARLAKVNSWETSVALTAVLMQPGTILIDHGHFQYNTVMLGFVAATIASMLAGKPAYSCAFFVASLGFKQMALFYAPAVAAYLAGICLFPRINLLQLIKLGIVTATSFALLFAPILLGTYFDTQRAVELPSDITLPPLLITLTTTFPSLSSTTWYYPYLLQLTQSIHRIFPFSRGLFEDKVANLWCAIHTSSLHKLTRYPQSTLSRASLLLTLIAILPPTTILFLRPRRNPSSTLPLAFAATSWAFFLCSYQVHEKNVLLPLLPMTLLLAGEGGLRPATRAWVGYANLVACWTMFPLLKRDELRVPYAVLTALWAYLIGVPGRDVYARSVEKGGLYVGTKVVHLAMYAVMLGWHVVEAWMEPPKGKPDLWVVANVCVGAAAFGLCYLWCLWGLMEASGLFGWLGIGKGKQVNVGKKKQ